MRTRLAARGSAQSPAARSLGRTRRLEERALLQNERGGRPGTYLRRKQASKHQNTHAGEGSRGPRILAGCAASAGPTTTEESFRECASRISELTGDLSVDESTSALREAFGWGGKSYWRERKKEEIPSVDLVEGRIQVLLDLGMTTEDVSKVISDFPEFLGCEEDQIRKNVDYVTKTFFVRNKALVNTLKRKPQVLGNIVDCEGNCVGDCNRCWVRF